MDTLAEPAGGQMNRWLLALLALVLAIVAWLMTPDGTQDKAPWKLCRYVCDQGLCPPCPADPTPPGRTMAPILVKPAPTPPAADL